MVHYERVKVASVDVPTPQHLSQNTPHSSPIKSPRKVPIHAHIGGDTKGIFGCINMK